ncbi:TlpA family protein disulfide reductase [Natranaerofaba carboxydovora]|uniref:TlpA family protein disulfide reductase n=1 Tax=Natranaerofaba carboxydovora TaxID=2742683 RepID=UPI001F1370F6|nr:TlpA disulfide reductase family protein [Natranaerofaba carboxydovora]UMZ73192.1 Thiol-disulfide oxidoreductase ResA [Natranaerofaba carboxydovora]
MIKKKTVIIAIFVVSVLILFTFGGCMFGDDSQGDKAPEGAANGESEVEGEKAYSFSLENLAGEEVSMDELEGKVVFVKFWGMFCPNCLIDLPYIDDLHNDYVDDEEVEILTVNFSDSPSDVESLMEDEGYSFEVLFDIDEEAARGFGVTGAPTYYVVDADGKIVFENPGQLGYDNAKNAIEDAR